jgi:uncharacterized repeat protein (TIGR03803 family)
MISARLCVVLCSLTLLVSQQAKASTFNVLHSFCVYCEKERGGNPRSSLTADTSGNLFGTTGGSVFELEKQDDGQLKYKYLARFPGGDKAPGGTSLNSLIIDVSGNLYGTAARGERHRDGLVFELTRSNGRWVEKILHIFCPGVGCRDGAQPEAGLTYAGASSGAPYDGVSPLYGTTLGGGKGAGVVYKIENIAGNWHETVLHRFCSEPNCADGFGPRGGLVIDGAGNLFGTTTYGNGIACDASPSGCGTVFELSQNGSKWTHQVLYRFCSLSACSDGANPGGDLVIDDQGRLVGTTSNGGHCPLYDNGCGTVYRVSLDGGAPQETVLYAFCPQKHCRDGLAPLAGVSIDSVGNIFGTTAYGGGNDIDQGGLGGGTVFELSGAELSVLHSFCALPNCADGEYPVAQPSITSSGQLYGTTEGGGQFGFGTLFEVAP